MQPATTLNPYLTFDGNCREAMEFYKDALGGELVINTFGQAGGPGLDAADKDKVMHAMLKNEWMTLMGSDVPTDMKMAEGKERKLVKGDNISISLSGQDPKLKDMWAKLTAGGKVTMPMAKAPWGDEFGMFTDKYGIDWMVNVTAKK